jgi:[ribosomal protein S5]-alanine N-acetyltransferase
MADQVSNITGTPLLTERLVLEMPHPAKASRVLRYLESNCARFKDTSPAGPPLTLDLVSEKLSSAFAESEQGRGMKLYLFLRSDNSGDPIGDITLSEIVRGPFQACYLGYRIGAEYEGRGFVAESVASIVEYAFSVLELHRIMANYMPSNSRSAAVLRRCGFTVEGLAHDYLRINGEWRDHVLTSRINPQWCPRE